MEVKGGEMRRLHIIYFLSRMGQLEQPHLIRVHHLTTAAGRGGVYLRDVKRWLSDLRGKDMPEAFSWSYKRKYKTGYVWQDLMDDELITPISDNEYVLQGSQTYSFDDSRFGSSIQNKTPLFNKEEEDKPHPVSVSLADQLFQIRNNNLDEKVKKNSEKLSSQCHDDQIKRKSPPPCGGSERSTITDEYESLMKQLEEDRQLKHLETAEEPETNRREEEIEKYKKQYSSLYSRLLNNKNKNKSKDDSDEHKNTMEKREGTPTPTSSNSFSSSSYSSSSSSSHSGSFTKSKSYSNGASNMLRHWITCGALDAVDTVLIKNSNNHNNNNNSSSSARREQEQPPIENPKIDAEIRKGDNKLGGSARVTRITWDQQLDLPRQHISFRKSCDGGMDSRKRRQKECESSRKAVPFAAAYKPLGGPKCSQCGKTFRPEKMHAHMKSCRGVKALSKTSSTFERSTSKSTSTSYNEPQVSAYFLTN